MHKKTAIGICNRWFINKLCMQYINLSLNRIIIVDFTFKLPNYFIDRFMFRRKRRVCILPS